MDDWLQSLETHTQQLSAEQLAPWQLQAFRQPSSMLGVLLEVSLHFLADSLSLPERLNLYMLNAPLCTGSTSVCHAAGRVCSGGPACD